MSSEQAEDCLKMAAVPEHVFEAALTAMRTAVIAGEDGEEAFTKVTTQNQGDLFEFDAAAPRRTR